MAVIREPEKVTEANASVQRLGKWRAHFAGWLLGTRVKDDPQAQWARDTAEKLLMMRVEINALTQMLVKQDIIDAEKLTIEVGKEAEILMRGLEAKWPGVTAGNDGLHYDMKKIVKRGTMKGWLP